MNISSKSWALQRIENAYGPFTTRTKPVKAPGLQEELQQTEESNRRARSDRATIDQVLNKAEKEALTLLFNPPVEISGMYGRNKVHQAQAGMFLDIKG
jgi:hypothetical protein